MTAGSLLPRAAAIGNSNTRTRRGVSHWAGKLGDDVAPGMLNSIFKQAGLKM
jgi:hypothetical protein